MTKIERRKVYLYFCGDPGAYDEYHPGYVDKVPNVPKVLYLLATEPGRLNIEEIARYLELDEDEAQEAISALEKIEAVEMVDQRVRLLIPVLTFEDQVKVSKWCEKIVQPLADIILKEQDMLLELASVLSAEGRFTTPELLYHAIGCYTLDWKGLDLLEENNILYTAKPRPDHRSYVLVGIERGELAPIDTNELLNSSQNMLVEKYFFSSFGDSTGHRISVIPSLFWRVNSLVGQHMSKKENSFLYNQIAEKWQYDWALQSAQLLEKIYLSKEPIQYGSLTGKEKEIADFLSQLNYLGTTPTKTFEGALQDTSILQTRVPVFLPKDIEMMKEISKIVLNSIIEEIQYFFCSLPIDLSDLTPVRLEVDLRDLSNEIWHSIFAQLNCELIQRGFISPPEDIAREGRYRKALYILPEGATIDDL